MLDYEVLHGPDVHYFYGSLELLTSYLFDRGVRLKDAFEVAELSADLESGDFRWFPWCGVTVNCRECPHRCQDPRKRLV